MGWLSPVEQMMLSIMTVRTSDEELALHKGQVNWAGDRDNIASNMAQFFYFKIYQITARHREYQKSNNTQNSSILTDRILHTRLATTFYSDYG